MTSVAWFRPEDLSAHGAALRRLARQLLGQTEADDVVQHAFTRALARPPRSAASLGAWLRRVVERLASDQRRNARRQRERELAAARPEQAPEPDAAEMLAVQSEVLAAVRALREPYRTAVWLRWFEDPSPATIAARLGIPVKTVKTRLSRALGELRARLDAGDRGRRGWATALLPLAAAEPGGTLRVWGQRLFARPMEVEVVAGQTREVEVEVQAAVPVTLRVPPPVPGAQWRVLTLEARGPAGDVFYSERLEPRSNWVWPLNRNVRVPRGTFVLEGMTDTGRRWRKDLVVHDLDAAIEPIVVELK